MGGLEGAYGQDPAKLLLHAWQLVSAPLWLPMQQASSFQVFGLQVHATQ